jgi:hypothetical protein
MAALPGDADLYWAVRSTADTRLLASQVLSGRTAERLIGRTDGAFGSVVRGGVVPAMVVGATGDYRAGRLRCGLRLSRSWKRVKGSRRHWSNGLLEIAVPDSRTVFLASTDLRPVLTRYVLATPAGPALPDRASEELARADLFVFLPRVRGAAEVPALPVQRIWLSGATIDGNIQVGAWFEMAEPTGARLIALAIRTAILRFLREAGVGDLGDRLRAVSVEAGREGVRVVGLSLTLDEVVEFVRTWIPFVGGLGQPVAAEAQPTP